LNVLSSTSAKTGFAPWNRTAFAMAMKVKEGAVTSSPFLIFNALSVTSRAISVSAVHG